MPLSQSLAWTLLRDSYAALGPRAWCRGGVPFQATCNPWMVASVAQVVHTLLCERWGESDEVVDVIELGAGSGRFGTWLAQELTRLAAEGARPSVRFRVVMTDLCEANVGAWAAHPHLRPLTDAGTLDFATFDASAPGPLVLRRAGRALVPGERGAPVVVVANYFWDSLPQDAFQVRDGLVEEVLVGLRGTRHDDPVETLDRVEWFEQVGPVAVDRYADPRLATVLDDAGKLAGPAAIVVPVAAARCLDWLAAAGTGLLLLSTDKGYFGASGAEREHAWFERHGGTVSLDVDFAALSRLVGGRTRHTEIADQSLLTQVCTAGLSSYVEAAVVDAFDTAFGAIGPQDYLRLLARNAEAALRPEQVLAVLRLGHFDPEILVRHGFSVARQAEGLRPAVAWGLTAATRAAWERRYPLSDRQADLAHAAGAVLGALGHHDEALRLLDVALEEDPGRPYAWLHRALSLLAMGQRVLARKALTHALDLDPDLQGADDAIAEAGLRRPGATKPPG